MRDPLLAAALARRESETLALVSISLDADALLARGHQARRLAKVKDYKHPQAVMVCQHCGKQAIRRKRYDPGRNLYCSRRCCALATAHPSPPPRLDLTGQRFGLLVAIRDAGRSNSRSRLWLCRCDCGREHVAQATKLANGRTRSCGCMSKYGPAKDPRQSANLRWANAQRSGELP